MFGCLFGAIFLGAHILLGPSVPININIAEWMFEYADFDALFVAPSLLEEIVKVPSFVDRLSKLEWIMEGEVPCRKRLGTRL